MLFSWGRISTKEQWNKDPNRKMRSLDLAVLPSSSSSRTELEGELSDLRQAALWYARMGFPVFPLFSVKSGSCTCGKSNCESPGKHPRTLHGLQDATPDESWVSAWWSKHPEANIGLVTGRRSGILVVDIDPRNGGEDSLRELISAYGSFPETAEQITGGGGRHIILRYPHQIENLPKTLAPGIDLKGNGGYIVVAPSITFGPYTWDGIDSHNALKKIAAAPEWVIGRLLTQGQRRLHAVSPNGAIVVEGQRNDHLTSLAGAMRRKGMDSEAIHAALTSHNRSHCSPPLPDAEVLQIANSVGRYAPALPITQTQSEQCSPRVVEIDSLPSVHSLSTGGIEFALEGLIPMAAVTMISGDAGGGKTTLISALGAHVACGEPFIGRQCTPRHVLILDRENTLPIVQERFARLGIQDGGNFKIWGSWLPDEAPVPGDSVIIDWVQRCDPKPLIIVDSLIAFLDGDENDASVVRPFMHQMRRLADAGAGVVVLHHTGKGETTKDYRGSSDLKASIDIGLNLVNLGEGKLERLRVRTFKTRFVVNADVILHYVDGEFHSDSRTEAIKKTETEKLTDLLREHPGIGSTEFQTLAVNRHLGRDRARSFLEVGLKTGEIRVEPGPKNAKYHYLKEGFDALAS